VWSRRFIARSSALGFLCVGMGAGAAMLIAVGALTGRVAVLAEFNAAQWAAGAYLGIGGGRQPLFYGSWPWNVRRRRLSLTP